MHTPCVCLSLMASCITFLMRQNKWMEITSLHNSLGPVKFFLCYVWVCGFFSACMQRIGTWRIKRFGRARERVHSLLRVCQQRRNNNSRLSIPVARPTQREKSFHLFLELWYLFSLRAPQLLFITCSKPGENTKFVLLKWQLTAREEIILGV